MRKNIAKFPILILLFSITPAYAGETNIGEPLSSLIQPGFYGRVDIGNGRLPPLVYTQPILISQSNPTTLLEPIYLHVPPDHAKDWNKHCRKYNACKNPVLFVRSGEYLRDKHYASQAHEQDYENFRYDSQRANKSR